MYLGRKSLGQEAAFSVSAGDSSGVISWPSDVPFVDVWKGSSLVLSGLKMPKIDTLRVGQFRLSLFLDTRFSVGRYEIVKRWTVGTYHGVEIDVLDVTAGGHADGAIISMFYHEMPQANFIIQQTDGGKLRRGKNPKV